MSEDSHGAVAVLEVGLPQGEKRQLYLQSGETVRVGRIAPNDLILEDRKVSRFHAAFSASESGLVVCDLASMNGTYLNGSRISTPRTVESGDMIGIGDSSIKVIMLNVGDSAGDSSTMTLVAEMKAVTITVLLADVCSYTKISASCAPADVTAMLQRWFHETSEIVRQRGGAVDKYIGDCVMAFWRGSKDHASTQAVEALEAGLAIRERTAELVQQGCWKHEALHPWRCRIALNSGDALMGSVGGAGRRDFTVVGDSVNVAFKIEDAANKLGSDVVMSEHTARLVANRFETCQIGTARIDGRTEPVPVFSLDS